MSEDGTSLLLLLLRETRTKLDDHDGQFATLNMKFDDLQETMGTGPGLAMHSNLRNAAIEAELEVLKRRASAHEGSISPTGH